MEQAHREAADLQSFASAAENSNLVGISHYRHGCVDSTIVDLRQRRRESGPSPARTLSCDVSPTPRASAFRIETNAKNSAHGLLLLERLAGLGWTQDRGASCRPRARRRRAAEQSVAHRVQILSRGAVTLRPGSASGDRIVLMVLSSDTVPSPGGTGRRRPPVEVYRTNRRRRRAWSRGCCGWPRARRFFRSADGQIHARCRSRTGTRSSAQDTGVSRLADRELPGRARRGSFRLGCSPRSLGDRSAGAV